MTRPIACLPNRLTSTLKKEKDVQGYCRASSMHHNAAVVMRRDEYELSINGNPVMAGANFPKRFFGNDLQKVMLNHVPSTVPTVARAERLNFV